MKPTESCVLSAARREAKSDSRSSATVKTVIQPAKSPRPVGPYSHAVRVGPMLFCSGQIPLDARTDKLVGEDIRSQTDRVLRNIQAILDQEKLGFDHIVKTTVYLTNLADFAGMNEVYSQYFSRNYPARSTVQVAALPRGAKVEIEAIAWYPNPA
jgi:2-iminobutanoate/2-iminopropanoate deaminase